jgi:uncharacterized BrkB/YihY/UPF0761 family membrane protein
MYTILVIIVFLLSMSSLLINLYELLRKRDSTHLISKSDKNILYVNIGSSSVIIIITGIMLVYRHAKYTHDGGDSSSSRSDKAEYIVDSRFAFG